MQLGSRETGRVPDMAEVADRLAIYDVLVRHSRGVDRADGEMLASAYWPDAEVAYGGFNGNAHEFCGQLPNAIRNWAHTQHFITNVLIEIDGGAARTETYVSAYHYLAQASGGDSEMTFLGRYLDHFEKRGDVWKIAFRRVVMDWNQNAQASAIWAGAPFEGLTRGGRHPEDPSYA